MGAKAAGKAKGNHVTCSHPERWEGFLLRHGLPTVVGLTSASQAFTVSACPAATGEMLKNLSDLVFVRQSAARSYLKPFTPSRVPDGNRQGSVVNVPGANTCTNCSTRRSVLQGLKQLKFIAGFYP